jgi:hypothetical protein
MGIGDSGTEATLLGKTKFITLACGICNILMDFFNCVMERHLRSYLLLIVY